ncbi:aldo/keto reductase [Marinilactibacillus piezotolerans]|uniref:aldo/keto reductase n=1 Tax=Marinilactibacillus piezotolerans TaxID=258723 RepID=UPI0015C420AD|nr:aldo/keto reductase [Marinilactibacillus piezotolerans]
MVNNLAKHLSLNDNTMIPSLGFGTAELKGGKAADSVSFAIKHGYRLIDTSPNYGNEEEVGKGIQSALGNDAAREDLFISTKVEEDDMSFEGVQKSVEESLGRLKLDYIDLLLIHSPSDNDEVNIETWKGFEAVLKSGKVKSIGISNFTRKELKPLLDNATVTPSINQVELAPGNVDWDTKEFCESHDIVIMSYSPLKKGQLDNETIKKLADQYGKSPQQIALRWTVDLNTIPIPRSGNEEHIQSNAEIVDFSLTENEVQAIKDLT